MKASKITAVDFFDDLTSKYARRRFFGGFAVVIVICLMLIHLVEAHLSWPEIIQVVLIEVVAGSFIILVFYALYVYFIGSNTAVREVSVTRPQDISERMKAMPKGVRHYMFWGRSGSFFRAYPLLQLDAEAREKKRNITIDVLLPDPTDDRLVGSYRDILKALGEEPGENPLLGNVLATCMACAIVSSNNPHLEIRIHLSRFLPAFRVDLSDNGAILTQDDKKKSALFFGYGSEFYDMFRSTVTNERKVSREIEWDKDRFKDLRLEETSCDERTLTAFGIRIDDVDENTAGGGAADCRPTTSLRMICLAAAAARADEFRLHPLGFFFLDDGLGEGRKERIHVWLPDGPEAPENDRHQHSYDIESFVVAGRMLSELYRFDESRDGPEVEYLVEYKPQTTSLQATGRRGRLIPVASFESVSGASYFLSADVIHRVTVKERPCITVVRTVERGVPVFSYGFTDEAPFERRGCTDAEAAEITRHLLALGKTASFRSDNYGSASEVR